MGTTTQFRFLNLPKELRLMVYDHLPTKVTHYDFEMPYENSTPCAAEEHRLTLVHKSFPAVSILATCRQINAEAGVMLRVRLASIMAEPVRTIATVRSLSTPRLVRALRCIYIGSTNCPATRDLRILAQDPTHHTHTSAQLAQSNSGNEGRHVNIVIRHPNRSSMLFEFYVGLLNFHLLLNRTWARGLSDTKVIDSIRPALLSPLDRADLDTHNENAAGFGLWGERFYNRVMPEIEWEEWERYWAEGERTD